jgi:hypothetical protein
MYNQEEENQMCNQVRGFHLGVRKFIAKIRMTFSNCADINLCMYVCMYFIFPSQTELKVHRTSHITIHMSDPNSKSSNILSDGSLTDISRPAHPAILPTFPVGGGGGGDSVHPEKTHDFRQGVDKHFSHESVARIEPTISEVKGACSDDCATVA